MHPDLELQEDPLPPLDPKLGPGKYKLEGSEWKHAEEDSTSSTSTYVKIVVAVATDFGLEVTEGSQKILFFSNFFLTGAHAGLRAAGGAGHRRVQCGFENFQDFSILSSFDCLALPVELCLGGLKTGVVWLRRCWHHTETNASRNTPLRPEVQKQRTHTGRTHPTRHTSGVST